MHRFTRSWRGSPPGLLTKKTLAAEKGELEAAPASALDQIAKRQG